MSLKQRASQAIGRRPQSIKYQDFDDTTDPSVPLHNDKAFLDGIDFRAKYIGSLEIPRPKNRPEIISVMRRIRYENKARGADKVKCDLRIAVSGIRVVKREKKKKRRNSYAPPQLLLESPIYRIFFVAHDSLDKLIFSMICRAVIDDRKVFICAVFKAFKKSHANKIVRTIGQVFEVCCRLQDGPDAAHIPGLLPPDKLKAIREKEAEARREEEGMENVENLEPAPSTEGKVHVPLGFPPAAESTPVRIDASQSVQLPGEEPQLTSLSDDYQLQIFEYQQQNYTQQQSALAQMAASQQSTDERNLLQQFHLTPQQQQALMVQYSVPGRPFTAASAGGSGLPSHPPNALGFQPPRTFRSTNVTQNQMMNDSSMSGTAGGAAADMTDGPGQAGALIDVSLPETNGEPVNPFTDDSLDLQGKDATEQVQLLYEMQRAQASQLQLLKDQLASETAARINAQAHVHHLLRQNNELAGHVKQLADQLKQFKSASPGTVEPLFSLATPPAAQPAPRPAQRSPSPESSATDSMSAQTEESFAVSTSTEPSATPKPHVSFQMPAEANGDMGAKQAESGRFSPFGFQQQQEQSAAPENKFSPFNEFEQLRASANEQ